MELPKDFRLRLFIITVINSLCSYLYEKLFIGWFNRFHQKRQKIHLAKKQQAFLASLGENSQQIYGQKGVRVANNPKLRDMHDESIGN